MEATKFTEVGFHGRDVDSIIRDLVDNSILLTKQNLRKKMQKEISQAVEDRIIEALCGSAVEERTKVNIAASVYIANKLLSVFQVLSS